MRLILLSLVFLSACSQTVTIAQSKSACANVKLQVLGAGGPEINDGLASSSFLIWVDGKAKVMIDMGGGSSYNFEKSKADFNDLDVILLTHLHVDHSAALPVYIKAGYFSGRELELPIYGPAAGGDFPSTEAFSQALFSDLQKSAYPYLSDNLRQQSSTDFLIRPISVKPQNKIWNKQLTENLMLSAINVNHGPIPAVAWRVNHNGCVITFSGDMNGTSGNLELLANDSHLLVANNAIPEGANRFAKRLHMQPSTIADILENTNVGKLLLSHFMLRSVDKKVQTIEIIRKKFSGKILLAKELDFVNLD